MAQHKITVCILDDDEARCLREEKTLDKVIADKKMPVNGIANFGKNYIARSGMEETLPAIEVEGLYYTFKETGKELSYELLSDFLDMLVRKGVIPAGE